jgi:hypothetical protein
MWLVRPVVSREKEKIRFSVSLLFFSFYLNLCSSSKLASCFGLRRCWRHVMEEEENEDEHVKTRSMCVYKHISILLHYSFFLFIYLFLSQTCIKTNSSEHTTTSLIPNGKRSLLSILSSLLHRVLSANRSIIIWKRNERKEMREKLAYRHVLHLSIFVLKENKGSTIGRANEREKEK